MVYGRRRCLLPSAKSGSSGLAGEECPGPGATNNPGAAVAVVRHWNDPAADFPRGKCRCPCRLHPCAVGRPAAVPTDQHVSDGGPCDGLEFTLPGEINRVTFNLINGPDLLPLEPLKRGGRIWSGRWRLDDGEWSITLDGRVGPHSAGQEAPPNRWSRLHARLRAATTGPERVPTQRRPAFLDDLFLFLSLIRAGTVGVSVPSARRPAGT